MRRSNCGVSIPFFSGLLTDSLTALPVYVSRVSIPFFSGLLTDGSRDRGRQDVHCLNPFLFRAAY